MNAQLKPEAPRVIIERPLNTILPDPDQPRQQFDAEALKNLRTLAHFCGIQLEGHYRIDREYLEIKSKQELIDSTPEAVRDALSDDWQKYANKLSVGELIDRLVEYEFRWGIPQDLQAMFLEYLPEVSPETGVIAA
jgi:hypothetical protein